MSTHDLSHLRRYHELDGKTFLVGVGAMKCATSWVCDYLASLDGVVSPLKELHFFSMKFPRHSLMQMDSYTLKRIAILLDEDGDPVENLRSSPAFQACIDCARMLYDDNGYFAHFARLCRPDTRTFCDISPAYAPIGRDGFDYLKAFCASQDISLKLLFIMRDPVDRLWAQLRWMKSMDPSADIEAGWKDALRRPGMAARAGYRATVETLDAVFAAEDVLYLFYETLFSDEALKRLCAFANVAPGPADTGTIVNGSRLDIALPDAVRDAMRTALADQYAFCRQRFGASLPDSWLA